MKSPPNQKRGTTGHFGASPHYYWATFRRRSGLRVRLDTRVYLGTRNGVDGNDHCIGCIIGKNPGSALPDQQRRGPVAISLSGDRFLPNVRAIVAKAYKQTGIAIPDGAYVQVLNLFYLCDRNLGSALESLRTVPSLPRCPTEKNAYPWAWYAWGGDDRSLNPMKARFDHLRAEHSFYFDGRERRMIPARPDASSMARHTQGLAHDPVVAHLASLVTRTPETDQRPRA